MTYKYKYKENKNKILFWAFVFLAIFLPISISTPDYGITWDEPIYMAAANNIESWFSLPLNQMFYEKNITQYWKTDIRRNVHPSGLKWIYLTGNALLKDINNPFLRVRLIVIFMFSFSITLLIFWWYREPTIYAPIFIVLFLTFPRFFAHAHFAATDIPMSSFLIFLLISLDLTLMNNKTWWISAPIIGFFLSIKFTSLILIIPIVISILIINHNRLKLAFFRLICVGLISLFIFYLLNPLFWLHPVSSYLNFLKLTLTRKKWTPFSIYYMGHFFSYRSNASYPYIMTIVSTPIPHLVLLASGLLLILKNIKGLLNSKMIYIILSFIMPYLIMTTPLSPTNDGVRYLLPSFPFAVLIMTIAIEKFKTKLKKLYSKLFKKYLLISVSIIFLAFSAISVKKMLKYHPYELSYYNLLIHGLRGASNSGFEVTYWWDPLNDNALKILDSLCYGKKIYFPLSPTDFYFKQMIKSWKIDFIPVFSPQNADYMLIYGRPNTKFWQKRTFPIFYDMKKSLKKEWELSVDSVPLLQLYSIEDL